MIHGVKDKTKGGNLKGPSIDVYLNWIVTAWEGLGNDLISHSFKYCGISNKLGGSEDDLIHCFKSDIELDDGLTESKNQRNISEVNEIVAQFEQVVDLEQDLENGFISENDNELVI